MCVTVRDSRFIKKHVFTLFDVTLMAAPHVHNIGNFGKSIMCARRIEQKLQHAKRFSMYGDLLIW